MKDDLRLGSLVALPIPPLGIGDPIGIITRVDAPLSPAVLTLISYIRKTLPD